MNILNKQINDEIFNFIIKNKVHFNKHYFDHSIEFYKSNNYFNNGYAEIKDLILNFDFNAPLNSFQSSNLYLLNFRDELNNDLIEYLLPKFSNHDEFFKAITKIIPINYCIKNKHWNIVCKFLTLKPNNSNKTCSVEESIDFINNLEQYHYMSDFKSNLYSFLKNNTRLLKRIEFQNHLLSFIDKYNLSSLNEFITINKSSEIFTNKNSSNYFLVNKKNLFSKFYLKFKNKEMCYNLFELLIVQLNSLDELNFCFIHQKEANFKDFLIIYDLNKDFDFENYLLYVFEKINPINFNLDDIKKINFSYFLELSIPEKNNKSILKNKI